MPGHLPMFDTDYSNPYGLWEVTTEGDEEGKSPPNYLGTFVGYLDEIAFALSKQAMYTLIFKKISGETPALTSIQEKVCVGISGQPDALPFLTCMLDGRPDVVPRSNYRNHIFIEMSGERLNSAKKQAALAKLTKEEQKLLGLTE